MFSILFLISRPIKMYILTRGGGPDPHWCVGCDCNMVHVQNNIPQKEKRLNKWLRKVKSSLYKIFFQATFGEALFYCFVISSKIPWKEV